MISYAVMCLSPYAITLIYLMVTIHLDLYHTLRSSSNINHRIGSKVTGMETGTGVASLQ